MQKIQVRSPGQEDPLEWQHTKVFLLEKYHGQRSLASYSPRVDKRVGHYLGTKQ